MQRLSSFVHVYDDLQVSHIFGPEDEVPDWARAKITNPACWVGEPIVDPEDDGGDGQGDDEQPTEEWTVPDIRAWADLHEVDLGDATKKADILKVIANR